MTDLKKLSELFTSMGVQFKLHEKINRAGCDQISMGACKFHFDPDEKYYGFQNDFIILERIPASEST